MVLKHLHALHFRTAPHKGLSNQRLMCIWAPLLLDTRHHSPKLRRTGNLDSKYVALALPRVT